MKIYGDTNTPRNNITTRPDEQEEILNRSTVRIS
jgi:hypothetical protein